LGVEAMMDTVLPDSTLQVITLTLQLASITTLILLPIAIALAWWLATTRSILRAPINALVTLPLVLPPTVLGFYLLLLMGPQGLLGEVTVALGLGSLSFTFTGLVLGSVLYSLPFAIQPIQIAFESIGARPMEVAATLRAKPFDAFISVALPMSRAGLVSSAILCFAHTIGEFGVVLMIGGNIPGQTQVLSTQIYSHVEAMEYAQAHMLAAGMLFFSFLVLLALSLFNRRSIRILN
jgi:molybdate transport system permease protein